MKTGAGLLILGLALLACSRTPAPEASDEPVYVVLCQVPWKPPTAVGGAVEAIPPGSRVVVADLAHPTRPVRVLSDGLHAAAEAAVSHDEERVCFVAREEPSGPWAIYACRLDGSERARVTSRVSYGADPAWLPDGRIVYSASVGASLLGKESSDARALFVAPAGGGSGERITFSGVGEVGPAVLSDGRIVYAGWRAGPTDDPESGRMALFTVHPDGTGVTLFHEGAQGVSHYRPRQGPDGDVYSLRRTGDDLLRIAVTDWRAPLEPAHVLDGPADVVAVEPMIDGSLLVVTREPTTGRNTLRRLTPEGTSIGEPLFADPAWETVLAVDATPRPRPQGHLSTMNVTKEFGSLLAIDTHADDVEGAVAVRLKRWVREYEDEPAALESLGQVPLEEDGSFFVRVPPDVPLVVELLDEAGKTLKASRTPFWVRPNEIRGCTGCHDPADTTPPNRRPMAVAQDPVLLRGDTDEGSK